MPLQHRVQEITLNNGARGLFVLVPGSTSVHYEFQFRAGDNFVARKAVSETAHLLEHMAFGANAAYPTIEDFSHEFTRNGAYSNASTSHADLVYEADCGIMEWDRILRLQKLSITKPVRSQALLDAEKGNVREELIGSLNDNSRVIWQQTMRQLGLKRLFDAEDIATIDAVTLGDIDEHYQRTHTSDNMRFVVVGDVEQHIPAIRAQIESWELPRGKRLPLAPEQVQDPGLIYIHRKEVQNLNFAVGFFLNRDISLQEIHAMSLLTHVLTNTFHSRIWGPARARGICYGMGSGFGTQVTGIAEFGITGEVSFGNATELFELIIEQLNIVARDGISVDELAQAKLYQLGASQMDLETVSELAEWYSDTYFARGEVDLASESNTLMQAVTNELIQQTLHDFMTNGVMVFGGVGDISRDDMEAHYKAFVNGFKKG